MKTQHNFTPLKNVRNNISHVFSYRGNNATSFHIVWRNAKRGNNATSFHIVFNATLGSMFFHCALRKKTTEVHTDQNNITIFSQRVWRTQRYFTTLLFVLTSWKSNIVSHCIKERNTSLHCYLTSKRGNTATPKMILGKTQHDFKPFLMLWGESQHDFTPFKKQLLVCYAIRLAVSFSQNRFRRIKKRYISVSNPFNKFQQQV